MSNTPIYVVISFMIFLIIQIFPGKNTNPPVKSINPFEEPTQTILRRACYNCHSNDTIWPWYSYIAPVSWMVIHDVNEAREKLNFSLWAEYTDEEKKDLKDKIRIILKNNEMPPTMYVWAHMEARLTTREKKEIYEWSFTDENDILFLPPLPFYDLKNRSFEDSIFLNYKIH